MSDTVVSVVAEFQKLQGNLLARVHSDNREVDAFRGGQVTMLALVLRRLGEVPVVDQVVKGLAVEVVELTRGCLNIRVLCDGVVLVEDRVDYVSLER